MAACGHKMSTIPVFHPPSLGTVRDFMPKFVLGQDELIVVEETMLLGVKLRSDLSWSGNTEYIVKRANKKLWCLRRLKRLSATRMKI